MVKLIRCEDCGRILDDYDIEHRQEYRGEFWGAPAYETVGVCGFCGSDDINWDYDPTERCRDCKHFNNDDGDWHCATDCEEPCEDCVEFEGVEVL